MHPSPLLFLLFLTFATSFSAASPPLHLHSHFTRLRQNSTQPQESIEITRPLPYSSLTPTCRSRDLSHTFGNTYDLPPANASYSAPRNCTWSRVVLYLSGASNGSQYDRIAAVWLSGAELLRTSTPEPTPDGIFWNVRKDVTKYSSILRQSNLTLSVMLQNIVNDVYTASFRVNITFLYYDVSQNGTNTTTNAVNPPLTLFPPNRRSTLARSKSSPFSKGLRNSLELNENPADLIIPISASGEEGFWFKLERESDLVYQGIRIPLNTYRAVIEVYVSYHGNDEFWYSNPPDSYLEMNGLDKSRGHGSYREVLVKLDDNVVGSAIPVPVIFTGGINPLFWEPISSIGAFDLPSYEIELTPFLGMLLDGKVHFFGLSVDGAISFWLVDANLHLWLDDKTERVQAAGIEYSLPDSCVERKSKFQQLDGKFEIEGERESEYSGWVNSTAGNFTMYVSRKLKFENEMKFSKNGTEKEVEQKIKIKDKVKIETNTRILISSTSVERKYPLKLTTLKSFGQDSDTYTMNAKLDHSVTETKSDGNVKSSFNNRQKSEGWMFVKGHDVLSGAATTEQILSSVDSSGCFTRTASAAATATESADHGYITINTTSYLCASKLLEFI